MPRSPVSTSPVTLRDVARRANVSLAAASLALAGASQISQETKDKVRQASADMNYRPLRRRTTAGLKSPVRPMRRIGLVFITPYNPDASAMELFQRLDPLGVSLKLKLELAIISETDAETRKRRLEQAAEGVDGLLLVGYVSHELLAYATTLGPPCVLLGSVEGEPMRPRPPCCVVHSDMLAMGYCATSALIKAGHRRIGFFCREIPSGLWYERWLSGYRYAHHDAGLKPDPALLFLAGMRVMESVGTLASRAVLAMRDPPTGFVLPDPYIASSFIECMAKVKKSVNPRRIVTSASTQQLDRCDITGCAVVIEDSGAMARIAMRFLRQAADGKSPLACTVAPPFLMRGFEGLEVIS